MLNAGILPGDWWSFAASPPANNGEIVVALIEDEATVKRLASEWAIWLMPENDALYAD